MKKIVSIIALILCVCLCFTGCESIMSLLSGSNASIEYEIQNGEAIVKSVPNKSTVTKIVIPDEYEGVPVTKIADYAATNLEYVTEFTIGKNVNEIGKWALENNQHITAYNVDDANEHLCDVDGVIFTKDMKTLLFYPLAKDLTPSKNRRGKLKLDEYGKIIYESKYIIPEGVETIRTKAFYKCGYLKFIQIPDSVKQIEEKAFFRSSIVDLVLPKSLEFIGKDAFAYCSGLKQITIPSNIKQIDDYAFYNCKELLTVNIDTVKENVVLGNKWYPTNQGKDIENLEIVWKK